MDRISNITKIVTNLLAALAGTASIFYAFGFVIVNYHFLSFGIREFDLIKPIYLPAGILFLLGISVPILTAVLFGWLDDLRDAPLKAKWSRSWTVIQFILTIACTLAFFQIIFEFNY